MKVFRDAHAIVLEDNDLEYPQARLLISLLPVRPRFHSRTTAVGQLDRSIRAVAMDSRLRLRGDFKSYISAFKIDARSFSRDCPSRNTIWEARKWRHILIES